MIRHHPSERRLGTAAVELAVLLPLIFVPLIFGIWEIGRLVQVQQIVSNATREGGRCASTGEYSNSQIQQVVLNYLTNAGISTTNAVITVQDLTHPGDVSSPTVNSFGTAQQLDTLKVTLSLPFSNVYWIALNNFVPAGTTLNASSTTCSLVNIPVTIPQGIPASP